MFVRELRAPLVHLPGVGPATARNLARAGIVSVAALLGYYPRDWEDRSRTSSIAEFQRDGKVNSIAVVTAHEWFGYGRMKTLKIRVDDGSAQAVLVCFNRPFLEGKYPVGARIRLWGQFHYKYGEIQSSAFDAERIDDIEPPGEGGPDAAPVSAGTPLDGLNSGTSGNGPIGGNASRFGAILPVYPLTAALTQGALRKALRRALEDYAGRLEDELPEGLRLREGLMHKGEALRAIHFPRSPGELEAARRTLIYEELFYLEIMVGKRSLQRRAAISAASVSRGGSSGTPRPGGSPGRTASRGMKAPEGGGAPSTAAASSAPGEAMPRGDPDRSELAEAAGQASGARDAPATPSPQATAYSPLQARLLERLPFELTAGQKAALTDLNDDMERSYPMARLLQGDVGSGKTLVAFLAALRAVELGGQVAIMAPTELLARQHAENAARLLEPIGVRLAFLTGNIAASGRANLLSALAAGDVDIVVGTHALFSKDVAYRALRLVVVDEQHRFGVAQRAAVMAKGASPDLLMMSATPIPRTLALTVYGDLDVSVIPDLPAGRKPVRTHLAREGNEGKVYEFVRAELLAGRQAYFVYPLIDSDGAAGLKDAETMARKLAEEVFPEFPVALIHSRLDEDEKRTTMESFRAGAVKILVATSVVEVGVDVPNATCMVVEHAERFGLSALHQLRGRVGRGAAQSFCFLVYSAKLSDDGKARLKVMLETNDGFVVAEEDLKLRGPGQLSGLEQSGYVSLGIADPVRDAEALALARNDAFAILEEDPALLAAEHRVIAEVLQRAPPFAEMSF